MSRLLTVGLDQPEVRELRERLPVPVVASELVPRIRVTGPTLTVLDPDNPFRELNVSRVVFHGIFENDLPILAALAFCGAARACRPPPGCSTAGHESRT
jgi:hypothetical protein